MENKKEEHTDENVFDKFPSEINNNILSRLPVSSLIQFSFVRKSWHTLAHDRLLANLHFHQTGNNDRYLFFHREYPIQKHQLHFVEFSGDQEHKGIVRKIKTPFYISMPEFKVIGSCNGLLCLSNSLFNDTLYIYNPFTRKYKQLPESKRYQNRRLFFGFGFHSTTKEYKVVKIVLINPNSADYEVQIYSFTDETWRTRTIGALQYRLEYSKQSEAVLVAGRLHWVSEPGNYNGVYRRVIVSLDLADERFYEVSNPDMVDEEYFNYHLTVLGDCLSAFAYGGGNSIKFEIWVMKDYGNKDSWVKEYDILLNVFRDHGLGFRLDGREVRVLGLMKNGEILLEYNRRRLVLYDPVGFKLTDLVYNGIPKQFRTVVHYGTLNLIDSPLI